MAVTLHGYRHSVYLRIARLALAEKGVTCDRCEVDPFDPKLPEAYLRLHPFGRVPTLVHDGFAIYETAAITCYVDEAFPGPALQPTEARRRARMRQIIGIADSYGYWPLVRQVFAHAVFRPALGRPADPAEVLAGLAAAPRVLTAWSALADPDGPFLTGADLTLADLHVAAMIACFAAAPAGAELLKSHRRLLAWWQLMAARPAMAETDPERA